MTERLTPDQLRAHREAKGSAKTRSTSPTNALTKAVLALLRLKGCTAWRQNNGAVHDKRFDGYRAGSVTPGISDVLGYHTASGRIVAVEIKFGTDVLSAAQELFLEGITQAGGFACCGRSVEQVAAAFTAWAQQLPA